ncbi:ArsR/SmtB family transcription factor [Actinoplanes couchii]|uniref:Transcription regulator, ArsR family protein n=1 Tax=Actinoplanes couchii TaxID=403638 RepID=A0ABQ3XQK0_9ACTN|nr:metalloregulator ArsR/SmtB family transcription factor [Actinoplanes couchii]MDR6317487.1 DNA-binding transcriptional ArsR family regulator [Actinoplanes couchii]GID60790.1 putative transcription regulator, ArsR family protein [Actinoplanes couchii]
MDGFTLIADPTRRRILDALRVEPHDVNALIALLGVSQSLVSKHLRVLREAGAVTADTDGRRRVYRLAVDPLPDVLGWVTPYHRKWSDSFDRLAKALDRRDDRFRPDTT